MFEFQAMSASKPPDKHARSLGGLIHAYQKYDPKHFPSPRQPEPDLASAAFEHMMQFGSLRRLTPEELAKLKAVEAPALYASAFRIQASGNDFNLILQRHAPAQDEAGGIHPTLGRLQTVAVVSMSPQALKDLVLLIVGQIKEHEETFGLIETPYMKRLAEQKP